MDKMNKGDYYVKIEISGCCSEPLGDIAKRIAKMLADGEFHDGSGYGKVDILAPAKEPDSYDGMSIDESVLITVKPSET